MFTGIVQAVGVVSAANRTGSVLELELDLTELGDRPTVGESLLVDGVCLTVAEMRGGHARFAVSAETLGLTTAGELRTGSRVNVELAMRPQDRFGGHFVSGHVDGLGTILENSARPGETRFKVKVPPELSDMMVMKGSVAVDGISLTIAALEEDTFEVSLIPHTLAATTLQDKGPGARVNIECDMIGKWVRKVVESEDVGTGLTLERLREEGF